MYGGELPLKNEDYINNNPTEGENQADDGEILNLFGEKAEDDETVNENSPTDSEQPDTQNSDEKSTIDGDGEYASLLTDDADAEDSAPFDPEIICDDLLGYNEGENDAQDNTDSEDEAPLDEEDKTEGDSEDDEAYEDGIDETETEAESPKTTEQAPENAAKPRRVDSIFDFLEICIFTLAGVFILMSFFFRYSIVDGGSMMNTLQHQERLLLTNFLYTPECGDIVVVQDKSTVLKDPIVKRIIAVGGQTVKFTRTEVYVDGVKLDEPYVYTGDYVNTFGASDVYRYSVYPSDELLDLVIDSEEGVYYEILVPEGEIFVMGDHRNNSKDSRDIGTLHEDAIIGKAIYRFFPFDKIGKIE